MAFRKNKIQRFIKIASLLLIVACTSTGSKETATESLEPLRQPQNTSADDLKVYVMIGFHVDFYHSWRGDTPDDAGFGYDYRIIKSSIEKLNQANNQNKKAKVYWDFAANNWTLGEFVPKHFPDLLDLWKTRDPMDEFIVGPFNNGANSAATKKEFVKSIDWTLKNPKGYGLQQLFKNVGSIYRPQEMFLGSGQVNWLHDAGMKALILQYATYSFNAFSNFVEPLTWEERFNPMWYKSHPTDKPIVLLPALSPVDVVNFVSLEKMMVELREKQLRGQIKRNVVIHMNLDADAISWEPLVKSKILQKLVPNTGGLQEFIDVVNKYSWSDFTTPTEYLKIEGPGKKVVTVTQDLADGAFDGMASWAEKESTQNIWPRIEQSRMIESFLTYKGFKTKTDEWSDPGFFNRVLSLSTTHFGMATPIVNYQRYQRLQKYTELSLGEKEKDLSNWIKTRPLLEIGANSLLLKKYPRYGQSEPMDSTGFETVVIPIKKNSHMVPKKYEYLRRPLDEGKDILEIFVPASSKDQTVQLVADSSRASCLESPPVLKAKGLQVTFSTSTGIEKLILNGEVFGDDDFIKPFVVFKEGIKIADGQKRRKKDSLLEAEDYLISNKEVCSSAPQVSTVNVQTQINLKGLKSQYQLPIKYQYQVHQDNPYLYLNVEADIPFTLDEEVPMAADSRFLRHVDWRWRELALSQIKPHLKNPDLLRVWKMNYEGLISSYDINYEKFNPKNKQFDSLNNHLTPGWLAVSNGRKGMLVAFNTTKRSSFGAIPIRTKNDGTDRELMMNPFGSYFGQQMNYSHVGGEKLGTALANMGAAYIKPNAPSMVGRHIEYDLLIIPYIGDRPSTAHIAEAMNFAYPSMGFMKVGSQIKTLNDFQREIYDTKLVVSSVKNNLNKVVAPRSLAVAGSTTGVTVTWEMPEGAAVDRFQLLWKKLSDKEWQSRIVPDKKIRYQEITNLEKTEMYTFAIHSIKGSQTSELSNMQNIRPSGEIKESLTAGVSPNVKMLLMFVDILLKHHSIQNPEKDLIPEIKEMSDEVQSFESN